MSYIVPTDETAVITRNYGTDLDVLIPDADEIAPAALFILACATRYKSGDAVFMHEQIAWLEEFLGEGRN